jgi:UDP-4-amino-4,6-dideoxy-N-acetyl-beta-L-altrosamine transaminase
MVTPMLPYGRQSIDDEDVAAVVAALRGDWLTQGPTVAKFEESLCEATGAKYAVAVANGTAALHLACLAAGVRQNDVGMTSSITFVASANAIRYAGGAPELLDVDPSTALVSLASMEQRIVELEKKGKKPRVIIPVDFSGAVADLAAVRAIADRAGALVIEDAAHSLGATYDVDGRTYRAGCGVHAQMAILSFHPVKHVTTGEGGAITTNDESLHRELLELRTHGITRDPQKMKRSDGPWYYEQHSLGFNYRITDLQCALGVSQMRKLGGFVARRRELAEMYDRAFADMRELVTPLAVRPGTRSSYHLYVVQVRARAGEGREQIAARRRELFLRLREASIAPQVHYIPVHRQPDFVANGFGRDDLSGAEDYYAGCISLPMFPAMADSDVGRVVDAVRDALEVRK